MLIYQNCSIEVSLEFLTHKFVRITYKLINAIVRIVISQNIGKFYCTQFLAYA